MSSDAKMVLILLVLVPAVVGVYYLARPKDTLPPPPLQRALTDEQCKLVLDMFLEKPVDAKIYPQISKIQSDLRFQYINNGQTGVHYSLPTTECGKNLSDYFSGINGLNKQLKAIGQ